MLRLDHTTTVARRMIQHLLLGHRFSGPRTWRCKGVVAVGMTVMLLLGALHLDRRRPAAWGHSHRPAWLTQGRCKPQSNIAFLKNHKCASSAIQNILFRYGYKHHLNFALPELNNYFGGRRTFVAEMVRQSVLNKVQSNIFAMHTKWNYEEVRKVMPDDTVYFTIVREPLALFQSLFVYAMFEEKTGKTMEEFVRNEAVDANRTFGYLGYNQMTWDFGVPNDFINNLTAVQEMVDRADKEFGLVLVAERMEESLVLLAKYLCWDLKDMLVLHLNTLSEQFKKPLSQSALKLLRHKLAPDYIIYEHFTAKFERQVEAYGRVRMAAAVARLQEMKALLTETCGFVKKEASMLNGTQRPWSSKVDGFLESGGEECHLYSLPEPFFIDMLRNRQMKEVVKRYGMQPGPPLNAVPLMVGSNGNVSAKTIQSLRKTLIHKDNTRRGRDWSRRNGGGGGDGGGGGNVGVGADGDTTSAKYIINSDGGRGNGGGTDGDDGES